MTVAIAGDDTGAKSDPRIGEGRRIAERHCAACHATGEDDPSPTWANSNTPFRRLYERFPVPMLEEAARTGMIAGHDEMPQFTFSLEEARALLAYIDSLSPSGYSYVPRSNGNR